MEKTVRIGPNIRFLRNLKGLKQETVAIELGISQAEYSLIENSDVIDDEIIFQIAKIFNVTAEVIKEFNENQAFYSIENKVDNTTINENSHGIHQVFSPIEKVVELYERLLASEKEKIEILKNKK
ncbi:helix-turn-helix transcriptional regulator [Chryseobacterium sp. Ch-15]|uniref:Helix-turn-helix transcriptional regulator n=1 Tax=Chryseobacterium muglaense TaxID=2893752 RepID=A0A9Q3UX39_9FLAO|nr:helix-turn-helix transcriptional regulator [Chryseobacterium muglaense]MBD3903339.1 helix-turn-helix transcriptional regulator [Chryseobacterium muglaense]MCC9036167.1 helix-turn-helix transcriptional regulator [Chryseobacterium muglaense]MCM2553258.1 helix-turn-helix transcriptional regulator [Chryseobacterium muglaense]